MMEAHGSKEREVNIECKREDGGEYQWSIFTEYIILAVYLKDTRPSLLDGEEKERKDGSETAKDATF